MNQNQEPLSLFVNYPTQIINFPWDKYPIKDIKTFAWKSIIWFKHLADFDGVFWFDSSIAPDPRNFRLLAKLISEQIERKSCGFFYGTATFHTNGVATCARMTDHLPVNKGLQNLWYGHNIIDNKKEFLDRHGRGVLKHEKIIYSLEFKNLRWSYQILNLGR